jgi:heat-inducible transcriptional repressor
MDDVRLSVREQQILDAVVQNYITTAEPTGSRFLSKQVAMGLSPATIRNTMGDLEEKGYITQPHTSAGRVPTDKGYRYYVDCVMKRSALPDPMMHEIDALIRDIDPTDLHLLMEATSRALSRATNQLGVILSPHLSRGVFRHIHIFEIEPHRYFLHLTIDSGFVKTMVVEFGAAVDAARLEAACRIINERFGGLRLAQLTEEGEKLFGDVDTVDLGVISLFVPSIKKMLHDENDDGAVFVEGETNIVMKPEFGRKEDLGAVIEILGEKKLLMHLIDVGEGECGNVVVSIGGENKNGVFESFSVLKTKYRVGNLEGSLGVIGPKRMPYPYLISAVDYTAKLLGEIH